MQSYPATIMLKSNNALNSLKQQLLKFDNKHAHISPVLLYPVTNIAPKAHLPKPLMIKTGMNYDQLYKHYFTLETLVDKIWQKINDIYNRSFIICLL